MTRRQQAETGVLEDIPSQIHESEILYYLQKKDINWQYVDAIKKLTDFNDDKLADWLNMSVKTFREYRKPQSIFKENVKEHVLLLLALVRHGIAVFGTAVNFDQWLETPNFFFDNQKPASFLNTITGIRFADDRLTAMEFGDNV